MADKYTSTHSGTEIDNAVDLTNNVTKGNNALDNRVSALETFKNTTQPDTDAAQDARIADLESKASEPVVEDGLFYGDVDGNVALSYTPSGGLDAARVSGHFKELVLDGMSIDAEDGLFYTDDDGNVALSYTPSGGLDAARVSEHFKELVAPSTSESYEDLGTTIYTI